MISYRLSVLMLTLLSFVAGCGEDKKKKDKDDDDKNEKREAKADEIETVDEERLIELMDLSIEGFEPTDVLIQFGVGTAWLKQTGTDGSAFVKMMVSIQPCELQILCPEVSQAAFESRSDQLIGGDLSGALRDDPNLIFEFSEQKVSGKTAVGTHAMSFFKNGPTSGYKHVHRLFSHDETNRLVVEAMPDGRWPDSQEELEALVSHAELQAAAEAAFAVYASELFGKD